MSRFSEALPIRQKFQFALAKYPKDNTRETCILERGGDIGTREGATVKGTKKDDSDDQSEPSRKDETDEEKDISVS